MTTITTIHDYAAAMSRIDEIFAANPGTPEGDELERLLGMVTAYEERVSPMDGLESNWLASDRDGL